jgi:hypothetical protein
LELADLVVAVVEDLHLEYLHLHPLQTELQILAEVVVAEDRPMGQ